ncbi:MAG: glycosyltransferase family 4 protein [Pseudomonadota bacterium]|nr:glycosyltransferase family 4 protein [Pseudomonadota bacterium]
MRIVHFVAGWPPNVMPNGVVTALAVLAPALRAQGCEVDILAMRGAGGAPEDRVTYVPEADSTRGARLMSAIRTRLSPDWHTFEEPAARIARSVLASPSLRTADILYMEEAFGWYAPIARQAPMPVVVGLHGPWFLNGAAARGDAFGAGDEERVRREGAGLAAVAGVTAPSRFVLEAARKKYATTLDNAVVIPNPIRPVSQQHAWRLDAANHNEILFVGRFDRHKGADILLRAFAELAAKRPEISLTFAGPNTRVMKVGDRELSCAEFVSSIMPPSSAERVRFLGAVPFEELAPLRARAFLTVVPSRVETFGNALAEALAHGCPVVATNAGAFPEILRDGVDGLLAANEDAPSFARAIERLLDDPALAASLGASGRNRIESKYAPDRVAAMYLDYFRAVGATKN